MLNSAEPEISLLINMKTPTIFLEFFTYMKFQTPFSGKHKKDNHRFDEFAQIVLQVRTSLYLMWLVFQVLTWKQKLPLQTIMRMLQVLVPQVEKICIDK